MPNFGMPPQQVVLLAQQTITTNLTSAALNMPPSSSYRLIFEVQTVSGTSPTMVGILATSFDNGVSYEEILSTSTMTTSGGGQQVLFRPYLGFGDTATTQSSTLVGTGADLAAAIVANGPINPQFLKIRFVVGGTSPSFNVAVKYGSVPQDLSD